MGSPRTQPPATEGESAQARKDEVILGRGEGERRYLIVEQGIGRLERRFRAVAKVFGDLGGDEGEADEEKTREAAQLDLGVLHTAFKAFIPSLADEWEFRGFKSPDDLATFKADPDEWDGEEKDTDPSLPQLIQAIETIYRVNGGDRLVAFLGKFVNLEVLRKRINYELATRGTTDLTISPNSPQPSGESPQTPSGTSDRDPSQTIPSASPSPA